ncbi:hypothetical protein C3Y87_17420 [Carbonactinospora thermoautotrophica]|uniref:hypothetical protein n=1 Tax=Carbonactinospora thermoautotrophica TaxID=1469144 RepID=UPI00226F98E3|nr:hypothetical protein [Carbonactinospora thermoautotrophica]MCX9193155.1 hypothetical protein [Carbonactinospora thermoautotrophica]
MSQEYYLDLESLSVADLLEALNDAERAEELMRRHGWTEDDLLARAQHVRHQLAAGIARLQNW